MSLSEKIAGTRFSKGVAGYTAKEVDGFIADILPLVKEQEQIITTLRAKLNALEERQEETAKREHDSYRLLEAAKNEAEKIISAASKNAAKVNKEAKISAEAEARAADMRGREMLEKAAEEAKACIDAAEKNAAKIIAAADAKGKEMLSEAKAAYQKELHCAEVLSGESAAFEARFRTLVAETAMSLSRLNEESTLPRAPKNAAEIELEQVPETENEPESEPESKTEPERIIEELVPERPHESEIVTDIGFAGGKPLPSPSGKSERLHRRLYDTVTVTYEADDDFEDIKKIMRDGKARKDPTDFAE